MPENDRGQTEQTRLLHTQSSTTEPQIEIDDCPTDDDENDQSFTALRGTAIFFSLLILVFLQAANTSLMTTMQSTVARDLNTYSSTSWFTSAYLIPMSSLAPVTGSLARLFSPRQIIHVSSVIFALGHLMTSQAPELWTFLAGRAISGAGAAGILAVSIVLALELGGKKRRGLCIGLVNAAFSLATSLGAVVAGGLMLQIGWRALFSIQVPLTMIGGTGLFFSIPESFDYRKKGTGTQNVLKKLVKIDYLGAVTLTSFIVVLLIALSSSEISTVLIIVSAILLVIFVCVEVRFAPDPIIPVTLLKSRGTLLTCLATLGIQMSRWMVIFYTPVYAIAVRGWSPPSAGSLLIPTTVGFAVGGLVVGFIHIRRKGSFYIASITDYILFTLTFLCLAHLSTSSSPAWLYIIFIFLNGFVTSAGINYTLAHLLHLTPISTHFIVTSVVATFRSLAGVFGTAAGGGVFSRLLRSSLEKRFEANGGLPEMRRELIRKLLGSPAMVWELDGLEKSVAVRGYVDAIRGVLIAACVLAATMVVVQAGTGWRPLKEDPMVKKTEDEPESNQTNE